MEGFIEMQRGNSKKITNTISKDPQGRLNRTALRASLEKLLVRFPGRTRKILKKSIEGNSRKIHGTVSKEIFGNVFKHK